MVTNVQYAWLRAHLTSLSPSSWIRLHMMSLPVVPQFACVHIQNHKKIFHICYNCKHSSGMIAHDFMDYIGSQFHPSHSVYILVLSIFLVSSCDINLMCWEAIDDHLLWAYYRTFSFLVCLLFLLIWPCFFLVIPSVDSSCFCFSPMSFHC